MEEKIGRVVEFDNYVGKIVDEEKQYLLLDVDAKENIQVGDLVNFIAEKVGDTDRAFFVSKIETNNSKEEENNAKLQK